MKQHHLVPFSTTTAVPLGEKRVPILSVSGSKMSMSQIDLFAPAACQSKPKAKPISTGDVCLYKGVEVCIEQQAVPYVVFPHHFVCIFKEGVKKGRKFILSVDDLRRIRGKKNKSLTAGLAVYLPTEYSPDLIMTDPHLPLPMKRLLKKGGLNGKVMSVSGDVALIHFYASDADQRQGLLEVSALVRMEYEGELL